MSVKEQKEEDFHSVGSFVRETLKEEQDIELGFQIPELITQTSIHFMPQDEILYANRKLSS